MKDEKIEVFKENRRAFRRVLIRTLFLQFLSLAAAAALLYYIADMELIKVTFSAHRGPEGMRKLILPAALFSAALGFLLVGFFTTLALTVCSRRVTGSLKRVEAVLRRLDRGDLAASASGIGEGRIPLEETAERAVSSLRQRMKELDEVSREMHKNVLSLGYMVSGAEQVTLKELRKRTGEVEQLSKKISDTVKWFET